MNVCCANGRSVMPDAYLKLHKRLHRELLCIIYRAGRWTLTHVRRRAISDYVSISGMTTGHLTSNYFLLQKVWLK